MAIFSKRRCLLLCIQASVMVLLLWALQQLLATDDVIDSFKRTEHTIDHEQGVPSSQAMHYLNDSSGLNPFLNFLLNIGINNRGAYFRFENQSVTTPSVNLSKIIDPPWNKLRTRSVTDVNCRAIFDHDVKVINATKFYTKPKEFFISDAQYWKATQNCDNFIRDRGYMTSPVNSEEEGFPLAYSIVMYKDMELTERLLRAIYRPQNYYCIHVERFSSKFMYAAIQSLVNCFPNVFLTDQNFHVHRNYMSVLQPEFECMRILARYPGWRYFINLTGQEFPIRTNLELVRIFRAYNGANDVGSDYSRRFAYRTVNSWKAGRAVSKKSKAPLNATVLKGKVHIAVVKGFVDYILHDRRADEILKWLEDSNVPDEIFFAMLNHNPHLEVPGSFNGSRWQASHKRCFTRFKRFDLRRPCPGNRISHYICIVGLNLIGKAVTSSAMFVNKFHIDYEPAALDCLEEWHYKKTLQEIGGNATGLDYSIYTKQDFVKNHI